MSKQPLISIICPVYNEADFLPKLLPFLDEIEPQNKQVILIDGGSRDGSVAIIESFIQEKSHWLLLHNPDKIVPFALNLAIPKAKAPIISRIDAHCDYAPDYFTKILETFNQVEAHAVGGPTRTAFKSPFQEAVAQVISSPLGVGGSKVHQENYCGYLDSVTFGAWRKEIFDEVGMFDTQLKRNQDDEFHYRLNQHGLKVYQNPEIQLFYYPRNSWKGLFRQYFQYGLYKPLVLKKVSSGLQLRHLIPSGFTLYLAGLVILYLLGFIFQLPASSPWALLPLLLYLALCVGSAIKTLASIKSKCIMPLLYPTVHLAYGSGFLLGLLKKPNGK